MPSRFAQDFREALDEIYIALQSVPEASENTPWREGGWTHRQILGHLLDSATNNRQRFVRATIDGSYSGPGYVQQAWVELHGYAETPWKQLLQWWLAEHEILAAVVDHIPEDLLDSRGVVGDNPPVTLRFLILDYLRHQRHHLQQLTAQ